MLIRTVEQIRALSHEEALSIIARQQRLIIEMDRYICIEEFGEDSVEEWEGPSESDIENAKNIECVLCGNNLKFIREYNPVGDDK